MSSSRVVFYTNEKSLVHYEMLAQVPTSGTVYSLVSVAQALAHAGVDVMIAGPVAAEHVAGRLTYAPCHSAAQLLTLLHGRECRACVVVGHAIHDAPPQLADRAPIYYWLHNWERPQTLLDFARDMSLRRIVCVSRYHVAYYLLKAPQLWRRLTYADNPIDPEHMPWRSVPSSEERLSSNEVRIAFVGHPSPAKGFDRVVQLMNRVSALSDKPCVLHVFGDSSLYGDARSAAVPCGYAPTVLHGSLPREELYPKLASCHFAVSGLAGSETCCLSLLEAAGCGVLPVTINSGGQVSFLNHSNSLVGRTVDELPEMVVRVGRDPAAYQRLVDRARTLPSSHSPRTLALQWRDITDGADLVRHRENARSLAWFVATRVARRLNWSSAA